MKKIYKIILMLIMIYVSTTIQAQNFHVLNINESKDAHPSNNSLYDYITPDFLFGKYQYAVLNNIAYFTADDGIHGKELWRSDGTEAGTSMVKDITVGLSSSNVQRIIVSGNKIYFTVDDGTGAELYVSDGTNAGTSILKIFPDFPANPSYLTDVNGSLYFFAAGSNQIWKSDGTLSGTVMVCDLYSEIGAYSPSQFTNVSGRLFFVSQSFSDGDEVYTSDGTPGSTHLIKDINLFGGSNPSQLTAVNGLLCFAADDGYGRQLWVSDGTDAGTYKANNPKNIIADSWYGLTFTVKNNTVYFSGNISDNDGSHFCAYNTSSTANEVKIVKDINPGFFSNNLYNITNVKGTLFFTIFNGRDQVLWKSDGTSAGTMQVKNINPGGRNIYLYKDFENANGTLLFSFYDDAHGYEIWKSDGTEAGTTMIKDISPGVSDSRSDNITYIGNSISVFEASDGKHGLELWRTDGTEAGTSMVKNINKSVSSSSFPSLLTQNADSSKLLFVADDLKHGKELRITDGTKQGTHVVRDLIEGSFGSSPYSLVNLNNATYFLANIADTANHTTSDLAVITKLCKTDGTLPGTKKLSLPSLESVINQGYFMEVYWMGASSDLLYLYIINHSSNEAELWRSDGTEAGTFALETNLDPYYATNLKTAGNKLFFTNYDFTYGYELFVTNGTVAGTGIVKDIAPGFNSSNPSNFSSFNGKLYFTADVGYGPFVWSSDGTLAGTTKVKPLIISYNPFVEANNKLFFAGTRTVGKGTELYAIDGITNTAYLVKDIYSGPGSSNTYNLAGGDTLIYFTADDGIHGTQLWKSNGTSEGTKRILTTPDIGSSYVANFTTVHNELFFTINGGLWQSDGTNAGTHIVDDVNLLNVTQLSNLTAFDNKLAFTALGPSADYELYVGDAGSEMFATNKSDAPAIKSNMPEFSASVYPNPANTKATLEFTGDVKKVSVVITDALGRIVWQSVYNNQLSVNLPVEKLKAGTYIITVKTNTESKTVKLVKQ